MKETKKTLKIYNFSNPLMDTEVLALFGNKYSHTLPFKLENASDISDCNVIVWDGLLTNKNQKMAEEIIESLSPSKILLLTGEPDTLWNGHAFVKKIAPTGHVIDLPGWSLLPEEIIVALIKCHEKLVYV